MPSTLPIQSHSQLLLIDPTVEAWESLAAGVQQGIEVIVLNPVQDALEQIHSILGQRPNTAGIHVVSHGAPGTLFLGETTITGETLEQKQHLLERWAGLDVLLYGCEVGAGTVGPRGANGADHKLH